MSLKRFFGATDHPTPPSPAFFMHGVIDTANDTLLALGTYPPTLVMLAESMLDTSYVSGIVSNDLRTISKLHPRRYPEWSFDVARRVLRATNPDNITDEMRARATFASEKLNAFARAIYTINRLRDRVDTGLTMQPLIYAQKEAQARMLQQSGFDERRASEAPYVVQYAETSNTTLEHAANEILFHAQLDRELLEKTERARLTLFKKIKFATSAKELKDIMATFYRHGPV